MEQNVIYIDASRKNSIANNDTSNSIWEYKLNEGLRLPAGTQVQVTNSFINKKGITGNSIELAEDINETFQVGYYVPQNPMLQQKPFASPKDDRVVGGVSQPDPLGSGGLQTSELHNVNTLYYDCMVSHNVVHSDGLPLFSNVLPNLLAIATDSATFVEFLMNGDLTSQIKAGMPIQLKGLVKRDSNGNAFPDGRESLFCRKTWKVDIAAAVGGDTAIKVINSEIVTTYTADGGLYDPIVGGYGDVIFTPDLDGKYRTLAGTAYINSLTGTEDDGSTKYEQTRTRQALGTFDGAGLPAALPANTTATGKNVIYQGGFPSDFLGEEYRSTNASYLKDPVFNMSQTSVSAYDFDKCSFSFFLAPNSIKYDSSALTINPATDVSQFDYGTNYYGLNGHTIREHYKGMNVQPEGTSITAISPNNGALGSFPYPYCNPRAEYPRHTGTGYTFEQHFLDPKPAQPAKFADVNSPQMDYIHDGFSYDSAPARIEFFTGTQIEMKNFTGDQDPFKDAIYQGIDGANSGTHTETTLKTLPSYSFLDRTVISQSTINGLMQRSDSHPYIRRTYTITDGVPLNRTDRQLGFCYGYIEIPSTNPERYNSDLFPFAPTEQTHVAARFQTSRYGPFRVTVPVAITEMDSDHVITKVEVYSNLELNGQTLTLCFPRAEKALTASVASTTPSDLNDDMAGYSPCYASGDATDMDCRVTIDTETVVDQNQQLIPIFSAKGCFSEQKGDSELYEQSTKNDIDLGGGQSCKFNYFVDSMHEQEDINLKGMVGEPAIITTDSSGPPNIFSTPFYNHNYNISGTRKDLRGKSRVVASQAPTSKFGGIHPRRVFTSPTGDDGLKNFQNNVKRIQDSNYLFGSTKHCSMGGMRNPENISYQAATPVFRDDGNQNGLTNLHDVLKTTDLNDETTTGNLKVCFQESRRGIHAYIGQFVAAPISPWDTNAPDAFRFPVAGKVLDFVKPNFANALGDSAYYPYSTPQYDFMDTGGTGSPLCLVQLQAIIDDYSNNYNDYVLRPLVQDINVNIAQGTYSIEKFLDVFNSQLRELDPNEPEDLSKISNNKLLKKFTPLNGNALAGGQVSLVGDFLRSTHDRTVFSTDENSDFVQNPLVVAVSVQVYNDLVRAWELCGTAEKVSFYLAAGDTSDKAYRNTSENITIGGGSFVWKNFRDKFFWAEFVDKYSDKLEEFGDKDNNLQLGDDVSWYAGALFAPNSSCYDNTTTVLNTPDNRYSIKGTTGYSVGPADEFPTVIDTNLTPKIDHLDNYNPLTNGIYVGAPTFGLTYDQTNGVFSLQNLHYGFRIPSVDLTGESAYPESIENQKGLMYRNLSELVSGNYNAIGTSAELTPHIKQALETPIDKISGVFIFNMAKNVAEKAGDFIDSNSNNLGRTFNDYFQSDQGAQDAWATTFWSRLGFAYSTFNTRRSNLLGSYYLEPSTAIDNTQDPITSQSSYLLSLTTDAAKSVKTDVRQALITNLSDGTVFNKVSRNVNDNYLPGITTGEKIDIEAVPTVASLPGITDPVAQNELVRLYNNGSISSVRSMTGGFVNFGTKLCQPPDFNATTNPFGKNVRIADGYITAGVEQGIDIVSHVQDAQVNENDVNRNAADFNALQGPFITNGMELNQLYNATPQLNWYDKIYNTTDFKGGTERSQAPAFNYSQTNFMRVMTGTNDQYNGAITSNNAFYNPGLMIAPSDTQYNMTNGVYTDSTLNLTGSLLLASQCTPIISQSNDILATNPPTLTTEGYFIITSDLIKNYDSIKSDKEIPILAIVPISSLSSQDFITAFNDIVHTLDQDTILNSIKIRVLNPDLTMPQLENNSSIIIRIQFPDPTQDLPLATPSDTKKKVEKTIVEG